MTRSPIKWVGGKSRLRNQIVPLIPDHDCYVEPFGGAGWILFHKPKSKVEVFNDLDGELINFFRVVKDQPEELLASFEWTLASREEFTRLLNLDTMTLSTVQRAHRFYYLIMASWGGELGSARFQTSITDNGHGNRLIGALKTVHDRIRPAHERLQTVIIENLSWEACLERYDNPHSFFYLDPPYPANKCNYQHNMRAIEDHHALFDRLNTLKARWILSTYDTPELRRFFDGYHVKPVTFRSGMSGNGYTNSEILVTNYPLPGD